MDAEISPRDAALEALLDAEAARYQQRTPAALHQLRSGARRLPLGVASTIQSHYPYPLVIDRGAGQHAWDLDGNRYLDLHGGFGVGLFGHAHPAIAGAVSRQAALGLHFAAPSADLMEWADLLCERVGMDQVRLCCSGTEATMDALRVARAHTGREIIVKIEGGYHGHHDGVLLSIKPPADGRPAGEPFPESEGIPAGTAAATRVVELSDLEQMAAALSDGQAAAVILEPVMCNLGMTRPDAGYLQGVRELCDRHGTLLIFDQVKTALAVHERSAAGLYGVQPDLHCLGKAIGGGVPVGAFGGRRAVMDAVTGRRVIADGTFSGSALAAATGLAAIRDVLTPDAYAHYEQLNQALCEGLGGLAASRGLPCHVETLAAKGGMFFSPRRARSYREWLALTDHRLAQLHWMHMANRGIWLAPGADEQWTLPVQMTEADCQAVIAAAREFADAVAALPA